MKNVLNSFILGLLLISLVSATDCSSWAGNTTLFPTIKVINQYGQTIDSKDIQDGQFFGISGTIKNIGTKTAYNVKGLFKDIPSDWDCIGGCNGISRYSLSKNTLTSGTIWLTKGPTDANIYLEASACNSQTILSEQIPIPISILVSLGLLSFITFFVIRKYRKSF